jgi:hypothetical protein
MQHSGQVSYKVSHRRGRLRADSARLPKDYAIFHRRDAAFLQVCHRPDTGRAARALNVFAPLGLSDPARVSRAAVDKPAGDHDRGENSRSRCKFQANHGEGRAGRSELIVKSRLFGPPGAGRNEGQGGDPDPMPLLGRGPNDP